MDRSYVVYKHTNLVNGKVYIGITNDIDNRWRNNGIGYKPEKGHHQLPFWNAVQKYGWDNFKHEVILDGLSFDEACSKEKFFIKELKTQDRRFGYNVADGGNGGRIWGQHPKGMLGKHQTDFQRTNQSDFMKKHNPMNHVVWGVTNEHPKGMLGKHQTEHQKRIAKASGINASHGRAVKVTYKDGSVDVFKTISVASSQLNVSYAWLWRNLKSDGAYHLTPQVTSNREALKKLDGAIIEYIEKIPR